jgi:hypothetical protein
MHVVDAVARLACAGVVSVRTDEALLGGDGTAKSTSADRRSAILARGSCYETGPSTRIRSRLVTVTPPGFSIVTANAAGLKTGSFALIGTM